jgi:eukaryotic-like serine/threonine-protein kinase
MKSKKYIYWVIVALLGSILLSACGGGLSATSWPGVTIAEDIVYLSGGSSIAAIRASDGTMIWRYPEKADSARTFYAPPELAGGQLTIGDYKDTLHSLDPATGAEKWSFTQAKNRYIGSTLTLDEMILAPNSDYNLYALSPQGGLSWTFPTTQANWARPVADSERIYLGSMDHSLYALNRKDGKQVWRVDLGGAILESPALSDKGVIYTGTLAQKVAALNATTGKIIWSYNTQGTIWSSPLLVDDTVYIGDLKGIVYALDAATGKLNWQMETGSSIVAGIAAYPDGIVVVDEKGDVFALSKTGEKLWTRTISGKLFSKPAVSADKIVIGITSGESLLSAYDFKGNELWKFQFPK